MRKFNLSSLSRLVTIILLSSSLTLVVVENVNAREIKAKLAWFNITKLSFRVNGIIANIDVKPGDRVKKKDKLINLDQREYTDNIFLTKSLLKSRKGELDEAKRELDRALELFDRTVLSEHELQTVKNNFILSETRYITANKNWLKAKRELEFSNITAPFDAVVLDVKMNQYETVISSFQVSPAIIIADADKLQAEFKLTIDDVIKLKANEIVDVVIAGVNYKGTLVFPSLLAIDGLYPVSAIVAVPFEKVKPGLDVTVNIP